MKYNEDDPDNLDGLGGMLPAEVLKMLNELLEQMHRTGHINQGSKIEVVYVASGGQHVETIQKQIIASHPNPSLTPRSAEGRLQGKNPSPKGEGNFKERGVDTVKDERNLPEVLATNEAMMLWKKVRDAGYVDDHYQPLISRTQAALLADAMAERLGIKEKWKVFETLWNRNYMRSDYNLALTQQQSLDFQDELKSMFK
ncbi:hypothetical protein [Xylanibacter ruminicola]|uniref:Uncharacterized protein n=1 Tax=Xylanibacter ruminicola TaxID=839 RepID=A0A1M6UPJ6_XYLRU|nr:hypothetical protein [Xylanibacter ruminicola]SHK71137.1 hypothetical protein SAMN05216463_11044 [Xylanibacter ruminicola]